MADLLVWFWGFGAGFFAGFITTLWLLDEPSMQGGKNEDA